MPLSSSSGLWSQCGRTRQWSVILSFWVRGLCLSNLLFTVRAVLLHEWFLENLQFLHHLDEYHWRGMHWMITFDSPVPPLTEFREDLRRDLDVIRHLIARQDPDEETVQVVSFSWHVCASLLFKSREHMPFSRSCTSRHLLVLNQKIGTSPSRLQRWIPIVENLINRFSVQFNVSFSLRKLF